MKKLLSSVLLGLSCLISAQANTLKIAFFDFAPYSFQEEGELKGIMVEMTRLACQRWEEGCQLKLWPNRRARQQMNSGETGAMGLAWQIIAPHNTISRSPCCSLNMVSSASRH